MKPEWAKLREAGWKFSYDSQKRYLFCEHKDGEVFSVCVFNRYFDDQRMVLANQIGATFERILNGEDE